MADPRPMPEAPTDGTPVRLFDEAGTAIATYWTAERCRAEFGPGEYRGGWFLIDDDSVEVAAPVGWAAVECKTEKAAKLAGFEIMQQTGQL